MLSVSVPVAPSQSRLRLHNDVFSFDFLFRQTGHLLLRGRIVHPVINVGHMRKSPAYKTYQCFLLPNHNRCSKVQVHNDQ